MATAKTVKDVSPLELVKAYATNLKRSGKVRGIVIPIESTRRFVRVLCNWSSIFSFLPAFDYLASTRLVNNLEHYWGIQNALMDETMKQFQLELVEVEIEAENLLLARHELVEIDRVRNGNREALTALRKRARSTKTSVPLPFEPIMRNIESRPLIKEVCATCGDHNSREKTWFMFPGTDVFATVPFHAAHTILEEDQGRLDYESKKLQSCVKEKSFLISEKGVLSDKISPGVLRSLVTLSDKPKIVDKD